MDRTKDPLVSICCITYNHEKYIKETIEGFLMQKTDFLFEIIIHDDASTDNTAKIVREYGRKYPDIIKPIYQTENQYSKCEKVIPFTLKAARGKYIALCEGDDYWIDPLKLQKQIIEMNKHPECYISFHPAIRRKLGGGKEHRLLGLHSNKNMIFSTEEVILGGGGFMPTASIVLNHLVIPKIISFFDIAKDAPMEDYYIQVLGAEHGGALYLSDRMSVYRSEVPSSWSERISNDPEYLGRFLRLCVLCNTKLNDFTKCKYSESFKVANQKFYSSLIRSLYFDINAKKTIICNDMDKIGIIDLILWNAIFKRPIVVNILCSMHQYALQISSCRIRRHPKC